MAAAQGRIEALLMLRHGEQQLLSIIIPMALLIGAATVSFLPGDIGLGQIFPMVLAVAATSAGFTGQAISVAFDRRYGALKRTGASGVPTWTIITGKILAVLAMSIVQLLLLSITATILGFRTSIGGIALAAVVLLLGVAAFTALGLTLGGTQSPEVVLALANLVWFFLLGIVGWTMYTQGLGDNGWLTFVPTVALAGGLTDAFSGVFPGFQIAVLTGWLAVASFAAVKWFRFDA